jgi:hypothetical protein
MKLKTTYEKGLAALKNYSKGFKGKITLSGIKDVNKAFSLLKVELAGIEEASNVKREELNELRMAKKPDNNKIAEKSKQLQEEFRKIADNVVVEMTEGQLKEIQKTLNDITFEEADDKETTMLMDLTEFLEDIDSSLTNK